MPRRFEANREYLVKIRWSRILIESFLAESELCLSCSVWEYVISSVSLCIVLVLDGIPSTATLFTRQEYQSQLQLSTL